MPATGARARASQTKAVYQVRKCPSCSSHETIFNSLCPSVQMQVAAPLGHRLGNQTCACFDFTCVYASAPKPFIPKTKDFARVTAGLCADFRQPLPFLRTCPILSQTQILHDQRRVPDCDTGAEAVQERLRQLVRARLE
eukprot:6190787-Pleurochrysis_carterae.AAC.4